MALPAAGLPGALAGVLASIGAEVRTELGGDARDAVGAAGIDAEIWNADAAGEERFKAIVFDATGIRDSTELRELHRFFHPTIRRVADQRADRRPRHSARGLRLAA